MTAMTRCRRVNSVNERVAYDNFDIVYPSHHDESALVLMKTSESPFFYLAELQAALHSTLFAGAVLIDQLLHSGNSEARFIAGVFDGTAFETPGFQFRTVAEDSSLRAPMCAFLRSEPEALAYSCLPTWEQQCITDGADI